MRLAADDGCILHDSGVCTNGAYRPLWPMAIARD